VPSCFTNVKDTNAVFSAQDINANSMCDCAALYLIAHKQFSRLLAWWTLTSTLTFLFLSTCTPSFRAPFYVSKALLRTCFLPLQMTSLTSQTKGSFFCVILDITTIYAKPLVFFYTYLYTSTPVIWNLVIILSHAESRCHSNGNLRQVEMTTINNLSLWSSP
jgi:hypothetical protein